MMQLAKLGKSHTLYLSLFSNPVAKSFFFFDCLSESVTGAL
jgi:hypothetical protein